MDDADRLWVRQEIQDFLQNAGGGHLPNLITAGVLDDRIDGVITRKHRDDPHGGGPTLVEILDGLAVRMKD